MTATLRIATLGAGRMAETLGGLWAQAGHDVFIGGRSPDSAADVGRRIGATGGSLGDAVNHATVLLIAIPGGGAAQLITELNDSSNGSLARSVLIDCTNALDSASFASPPDSFMPQRPEVAAEIARHAPGARVVKAFSMLAAEVWAQPPAGQKLIVPLCADDPEALELVSGLVRDVGAEPVRAGGLSRAALVEAATALVMGMWFAGQDARAMLPSLADAAAE